MGRVVHYYRINEHDRRVAVLKDTLLERSSTKIKLNYRSLLKDKENARLCVTQKADLTKPQGWRLLKIKNKIPLIMMKNSLLYVRYL